MGLAFNDLLDVLVHVLQELAKLARGLLVHRKYDIPRFCAGGLDKLRDVLLDLSEQGQESHQLFEPSVDQQN